MLCFQKEIRLRSVWILATILTVGWSTSAYPQGFVEQLSPPVLQRGTVNRIEVLGNGTSEATGLWSSLPAEMFRARPVEASTANKAVFDVELTKQNRKLKTNSVVDAGFPTIIFSSWALSKPSSSFLFSSLRRK